MRSRLAHARLAWPATTLLTALSAWTVIAGPAQAYRTAGDSGFGQPPPTVIRRTVAGQIAMMRTDGRAAIPRNAPKPVRTLIRQANLITGKPYKWGGGHAKLDDRGYDCSGAVSFALIKAELLQSTTVSGAFKRWGEKGLGRYITVYARKSHVYMEVAGLRLDTSSVGDVYDGGKGGALAQRHRPARRLRRAPPCQALTGAAARHRAA